LKLIRSNGKINRNSVAPRTGAWVETPASSPLANLLSVAPRVGAWVETKIEAWLSENDKASHLA
jgi:hypothetical protein